MIAPASLVRTCLALGLVALAPAAAAQGRPCADRAAVIERLETRFGEVRQAVGLNRSNGVVELFASAKTGTWTILVTNPQGVSCLIASGEVWESSAGPLLGPEEDA